MQTFPSILRRSILSLSLALSLLLSPSAYAGSYVLPAAAPAPADDQALAALQQISKGVSEIAARTSKGVVLVSTSAHVRGQSFGQVDPFDFFFGPQGGGQPPAQHVEGLGSGFIVDLDRGLIITNNHVVEGADEINLKLANGETYKGKVVGGDKRTDVAVVKIGAKDYRRDGLGPLGLADSSKVTTGDFIVALGAPFGLEASVSFGVVSAIGRGNLNITELGDFIQTDAAINPGNSGGPLLNAAGQVVGMSTAIYSSSGAYNGIGFAVPSNLVRAVAEELISNGKIERGYIGVQLQELEPDMVQELKLPAGTHGSLVAQVELDGPAAKAGIEPGDVITAIDGQPLKNDTALVNAIGLMKPDTDVKLSLVHAGEKKDVQVKLGRYPSDAKVAMKDADPSPKLGDERWGLALAPVSDDLAKTYRFKSRGGVVVVGVTPESAAARAGVRPGDVLLRIDLHKIGKPIDFYNAAAGRQRVLLQMERQGRYHIAALNAGGAESGDQGAG